jgi:hypothetical protein
MRVVVSAPEEVPEAAVAAYAVSQMERVAAEQGLVLMPPSWDREVSWEGRYRMIMVWAGVADGRMTNAS